ncbi:MAG: ARPP-1 family domain-containing protein [Chitinophagales bacterium]
MKKLIFTLFACAQFLFAYSQYNSVNLKADFTSGNIYTYGNLRLYPVMANEVFLALHKNIGEYTVLADAVATNKISVTELSQSGSVNTLYAENLSQDSIYVMAGEIVKGGKQDRIIAQDFILAPGEKVDVGAFCVEHGRWTAGGAASNISTITEEGNNADFNYEETSNLSLKVAAFKTTSKVVSADVREAAVVKKNQSEVWEEVADVTEKNDATSGTGTYNALDNSTAFQDSLKNYLSYFSSLYKNDKTIVGVVAVTGDKIIGADLFATNNLFINQYDNLLHSYITDAITNGSAITINSSDVQKYLDEFLADELLQKAVLEKDGSQFEHKGFVLHCVRF